MRKNTRAIPGYSALPESQVNFEFGTQKIVGLERPEGLTLMQVWIRSRAEPGELDRAFARMAKQKISHRKYLSHRQLIERFGADPKDMDKVEEYVSQYKICVKRRNPGMQMMELWGRRTDFSAAFKLNWVKYRHAKDSPNDQPFGRIGPIYVPDELKDIITRASEWNDPPSRLTRLRPHEASPLTPTASIQTHLPRALIQADWTGKLLAKHYHFPETANGKRLDGKGQTIALIELGQGYLPSDVQKFFDAIQTPTPTVVAASTERGKNSWESIKGEVITDIDVVGAIVPKSRLVVYFGERASAESLYDTVNLAVLDGERTPSIISISWGWAESKIPSHLITAMSDLFKKAALLGITICVATSDYGSLDFALGSTDAEANNSRLNVDFPACLEASLACGGTWITSAGEVVWNTGKGSATGGGVSTHIPRPDYQKKAGVPRTLDKFVGRGIPDVAGIASPYRVIKRGKAVYAAGTSFVAPMWAGLIARLNQAMGKRAGFINPILYQNPHTCKSITQGHNDIQHKQSPYYYPADRGWDCATGLGVPNGRELFQVFMEQSR